MIVRLFLTLAVVFATANVVLAQKSSSSFCRNYKFKETEVKEITEKDSSELYYKGQLVGYIACFPVKEKKMTVGYENYVYNVDKEPVAYVSGELGQLMIKYSSPYKVVYVKGLQFHNVVEQMVDKDSRLAPKKE